MLPKCLKTVQDCYSQLNLGNLVTEALTSIQEADLCSFIVRHVCVQHFLGILVNIFIHSWTECFDVHRGLDFSSHSSLGVFMCRIQCVLVLVKANLYYVVESKAS
jgi:hypothetical protein